VQLQIFNTGDWAQNFNSARKFPQNKKMSSSKLDTCEPKFYRGKRESLLNALPCHNGTDREIYMTRTEWRGRYLHEEVKKDIVISINKIIALAFLIVNEQLHCLCVLTRKTTSSSSSIYQPTNSQSFTQSGLP